MSVHTAVQTELDGLGEKATASVEAQTALILAKALDDRAGIQAGGLASTAKQLTVIMADLRDRFRSTEQNGLELIRSA